jgi:hypothetical protein
LDAMHKMKKLSIRQPRGAREVVPSLAGGNLAQPRAESRHGRRLILPSKCVGKSRGRERLRPLARPVQTPMNMNQPSRETPRHPEALGGLLSRPEALQMLPTEALFAAEPEAKPGPVRRKGVGAAMAPARGRFAPESCCRSETGHLACRTTTGPSQKVSSGRWLRASKVNWIS